MNRSNQADMGEFELIEMRIFSCPPKEVWTGCRRRGLGAATTCTAQPRSGHASGGVQ